MADSARIVHVVRAPQVQGLVSPGRVVYERVGAFYSGALVVDERYGD